MFMVLRFKIKLTYFSFFSDAAVESPFAFLALFEKIMYSLYLLYKLGILVLVPKVEDGKTHAIHLFKKL